MFRDGNFDKILIETDAGNLWDPATNEIKVPAAISYVKVTLGVFLDFSGAVTGNPIVQAATMFKPNAGAYPADPVAETKDAMVWINQQMVSASPLRESALSGQITVATGDRMKVQYRSTGGGGFNLVLKKEEAFSWMAAEFFA